MLLLFYSVILFFRSNDARDITLGFPDPPNDDCYILKPASRLHRVFPWLFPPNVACPHSDDGGTECCKCLFLKDFLDKFRLLDEEFARYEALEDSAQWPYSVAARKAPVSLVDRAQYTVPMEADLIRYLDIGPGWTRVSFQCRVTLSDPKFREYFTLEELAFKRVPKGSPSIFKGVHRLARRVFTYCTPSEEIKLLYPDSRRQYELEDDEGNLRDTTENFRCVPNDPMSDHKPIRTPHGIRTKWHHEQPALTLVEKHHWREAKVMAWGSKRKRTHKAFQWGIKKKRRHLISRTKLIQPASSSCQEIPNWRDHIGENAQMIARIRSPALIKTSSDRESRRAPYDPTVLVDLGSDTDNDDLDADDSVEFLGIYNQPLHGSVAGDPAGITDDNAEDDDWLNFDVGTDDNVPNIEKIDTAYFDFDWDESETPSLRSNLRIIATHSDQEGMRTTRILEESHSGEAFMNIHTTLTQALNREKTENTGVLWEDIKVSENTMIEACSSPVDEFARDLQLVAQFGYFSAESRPKAIESP